MARPKFPWQSSANRATSLPRQRATTTRHHPLSPQRSPPFSGDCIFEVDPSTRQRLCPEDTSAAASSSGYPASVPNMPSDHSGEVLAVISVAESGQHPPLLAEQGPCRFAGVVTMDDSSFTKIENHSDPVATQLDCVVPLDTGSPQTFINTHVLKSMKHAGAASAVCKRRTPSRSWGGFGQSPPLQTSTTVRLSVQFVHDDRPTASLVVWAYVIPEEARKHVGASRTRQLDAVQ